MTDSFSTYRVFILNSTLCVDDGKAEITGSHLTKLLSTLKIKVVNKNNMDVRHPEDIFQHLTQSGSKPLSRNNFQCNGTILKNPGIFRYLKKQAS